MLRQGRMRYDEILDEWEWLRGHVAWQFFGERVGIKFATWRDMFNAAAKAGDPRAVKHWRDEP